MRDLPLAAGRQPARERTMKPAAAGNPIPAKQIRAIRLRPGCTQTEFAVLLNVSAITAISWGNGTRKPSGVALRLLAVARHHQQRCVRRSSVASISVSHP